MLFKSGCRFTKIGIKPSVPKALAWCIIIDWQPFAMWLCIMQLAPLHVGEAERAVLPQQTQLSAILPTPIWLFVNFRILVSVGLYQNSLLHKMIYKKLFQTRSRSWTLGLKYVVHGLNAYKSRVRAVICNAVLALFLVPFLSDTLGCRQTHHCHVQHESYLPDPHHDPVMCTKVSALWEFPLLVG